MALSRSINRSPTFGWSFNVKLVLTTGIVSSLLIWRLYQVAALTENMNGFWYSSLNVAVVALATIYALKR